MGNEVAGYAAAPQTFHQLDFDRLLQRSFENRLMGSPGAFAMHIVRQNRVIARRRAITPLHLGPIADMDGIALAPDFEILGVSGQ